MAGSYTKQHRLYAANDSLDKAIPASERVLAHRRPGEPSDFDFEPANTGMGSMIIVRDPFSPTDVARRARQRGFRNTKSRLLIRIDKTPKNPSPNEKPFGFAHEEGIWVGTSGSESPGSVAIRPRRDDWDLSAEPLQGGRKEVFVDSETYVDPWKLILLKDYEVPASKVVGKIENVRPLSKIRAQLGRMIAGDRPFGP